MCCLGHHVWMQIAGSYLIIAMILDTASFSAPYWTILSDNSYSILFRSNTKTLTTTTAPFRLDGFDEGFDSNGGNLGAVDKYYNSADSSLSRSKRQIDRLQNSDNGEFPSDDPRSDEVPQNLEYGRTSPPSSEPTPNANQPEARYGLWRYCVGNLKNETVCVRLTQNSAVPNWLHIVQIALMGGIFFLICSIISVCAVPCCGCCRYRCLTMFTALFFVFMTVVLQMTGLVVFFVYHEFPLGTYNDDSEKERGSLYWAFYVAVLGLLVVILAWVFVWIEYCAEYKEKWRRSEYENLDSDSEAGFIMNNKNYKSGKAPSIAHSAGNDQTLRSIDRSHEQSGKSNDKNVTELQTTNRADSQATVQSGESPAPSVNTKRGRKVSTESPKTKLHSSKNSTKQDPTEGADRNDGNTPADSVKHSRNRRKSPRKSVTRNPDSGDPESKPRDRGEEPDVHDSAIHKRSAQNKHQTHRKQPTDDKQLTDRKRRSRTRQPVTDDPAV